MRWELGKQSPYAGIGHMRSLLYLRFFFGYSPSERNEKGRYLRFIISEFRKSGRTRGLSRAIRDLILPMRHVAGDDVWLIIPRSFSDLEGPGHRS